MRDVVCGTTGCENFEVVIEVPDDGTMVVCGVCGVTLAEQSPELVLDDPVDRVDLVKNLLATLTEEEWERLKNVD